jgi:predicted O-linked N-acetylglucosamine transferase (SPINDLY family)
MAQAITQVVLAAGSQPRCQVARAADSFADLSALPTGNAAEAIRNVALDVLIDYDGAHDYNNMELLALRMAPVQVRARPA